MNEEIICPVCKKSVDKLYGTFSYSICCEECLPDWKDLIIRDNPFLKLIDKKEPNAP